MHLTTINRSYSMRWCGLLAFLGMLLLSITPSALAQTVETSYTFALGNTSTPPVVGTLDATDSANNPVSYQLGSLNSDRFSITTTATTVELRYTGSGNEDVSITPSYTLNMVANHGVNSTTVTDVEIVVTVGICDRTPGVLERILTLGKFSNLGIECHDHEGVLNQISLVEGPLNLNSNSISSMKSFDFAEMRKLKKIAAKNNALSVLPEGIFAGLTSLIVLDLTENVLGVLPEGIFDDLSFLEELYLGDNALSVLSAEVFRNNQDLQRLNLSGSQLSDLPESIFAGLEDLYVLQLFDNNLSILPELIFADLVDLGTRVNNRDGALNINDNPSSTAPITFPIQLSTERIGDSAYTFRVRSSMAAMPISVTWTATGSSSSDDSGTVNIPAGATSGSTMITLPADDYSTITLTPQSLDTNNFDGWVLLGQTKDIRLVAGFVPRSYEFTVSDRSVAGTVVASDDEGNTFSYSLSVGDTGLFSVGVTDGVVSYSGGTVEIDKSYTLVVSAMDNSGAVSATAAVLVLVEATNVAPAFDMSSYAFTVTNSGVVGEVAASDANGDMLSYNLSVGDTGLFSVGVTDGEISYSGGTVENDKSYTLVVSVTDGSGAGASATVTVVVLGAGSNVAPVFDMSIYAFTVSESGVVGAVMASDADAGDTLNYSLSVGDTGLFSVGVTDGEISYSGGTVENDKSYTLVVSVTDGSGASASATVTVVVLGTGSNVAPAFDMSSYAFTVTNSGVVGEVAASDANSDMLSYNLSVGDTGLFSVGVTDGEISYSGGTVENDKSYTLVVSVTDGSGAGASATVTVVVLGAGSNVAPVFDMSIYAFTVSESGVVGAVMASDADAGDTLNYSLSVGDTGLFSVGVTDGEISYSGGTVENDKSYTLVVSVTDGSGASASATVTVVVLGTGSNVAPAFDMSIYAFTVSESGVVGTVMAGDAEGNTFSYSLSDGDTGVFSVGVTDGEISYSGGTVENDKSYTLVVSVTDGSGASASATVTVVVLGAGSNVAPAFEPANYAFTVSDSGVVGTIMASDADGDVLSYSLSVDGTGMFSVGVASGVVSYSGGTVASEVSYTLVVSAVDGLGARASATILVLVRSTAIIEARTQMVETVLVDAGRNITINAAAVIGGRFDVAAPHITVSGNALNPNRMMHGLVNQWTVPWKRQWKKLNRQMDWDYWQSVGKWDGKERDASDLGLAKRWDRLESQWNRQRTLILARWDKFRKNLVNGSSFMVPLGAADGNGGALSALTGWTVWGKGDVSGYKHVSNGSRSKGNSLSGYLGADYQVTKELLLGVAMSRSKTEGYVEQATDGTERIDIDTTITAVWPYANWDLGTGLRIWGALGRGSGTAEIDDGGNLRETDVDMSAVLMGVKQHLLSKGNTRFSLKADGFIMDTETDGVAGYVNGTDSSAHRMRLSLSADKLFQLSRTTRSGFGVDLGVRTDGGDSLKGRGLDLGAHLSYNDAVQGINVSSQARVLVAHSEDYQEWGLNATVVMKPGLLGRGLSLKFTPRWGHARTEINKLWTNGVTALKRTNTSGSGLMPDSTKLSLSYGLGYRGMVLRPYTSLGMQRDTMSEVTFGLKLSKRKMQLSVFGNKAHELGLNSTLRW